MFGSVDPIQLCLYILYTIARMENIISCAFKSSLLHLNHISILFSICSFCSLLFPSSNMLTNGWNIIGAHYGQSIFFRIPLTKMFCSLPTSQTEWKWYLIAYNRYILVYNHQTDLDVEPCNLSAHTNSVQYSPISTILTNKHKILQIIILVDKLSIWQVRLVVWFQFQIILNARQRINICFVLKRLKTGNYYLIHQNNTQHRQTRRLLYSLTVCINNKHFSSSTPE